MFRNQKYAVRDINSSKGIWLTALMEGCKLDSLTTKNVGTKALIAFYNYN